MQNRRVHHFTEGKGIAMTDQSHTPLLPCPFCGKSAQLDIHHENDDGTGIIEFAVARCSHCRTSKERPSPNAAIAAWNTRSVNSLPSLVKALEEIANTFDESYISGSKERRIGDLARTALSTYRGEGK